MRRVVVIGGGISGLAAAHRLIENDPSIDVTLIEASARLGGTLLTEQREGFLLERGPDSRRFRMRDVSLVSPDRRLVRIWVVAVQPQPSRL